MKQQGNSINPANIQHFADSAKNAIQLGQRQFFTPPDLAEALCTPFAKLATTTATDLMAGSGHLLTAAKRPHSLGIDVDERVGRDRRSEPGDQEASAHHSSDSSSSTPHPRSPISSNLYQADITRHYPLAHAAGLQHDLILLNPPFSLQWYLDRLAPLALSSVNGVKQVYTAALAAGDTIDSTLASLLIALDSLTTAGEGFMICNADTARRFLGCPQGTDLRDKNPESRQDSSSCLLPLASGLLRSPQGADLRDKNPESRQDSSSCLLPLGSGLLRNIWCWLDIPGAVYEGQNSPFPTAVLYFSASHGHAAAADRLPLYLHAPSADPQTVRSTLATAISARPFAFAGRSITNEYQAQDYKKHRLPLWNAVKAEYHQLHHGVKPDWNLSLTPDGKIRTFLDPFRRAAYTHNRELLLAFQGMQGQAPAALVVQQASRAALKHAITCGAWRVQPDLVAAVDAACAAYESVRAPFYTPNEVQSLGWLDEESLIPCAKPGIPGFRPHHSYPIRTWIEDTTWHDTKINLSGDKERLVMSGRELVVELLDDQQTPHMFHVRRDDATLGKDGDGFHHHHIQSLLNHFSIPIPRDVAQANPAAYQHNLARIDQLEALINAA